MFPRSLVIWSWLMFGWSSKELGRYPSMKNYICRVIMFNTFRWNLMTQKSITHGWYILQLHCQDWDRETAGSHQFWKSLTCLRTAKLFQRYFLSHKHCSEVLCIRGKYELKTPKAISKDKCFWRSALRMKHFEKMSTIVNIMFWQTIYLEFT